MRGFVRKEWLATLGSEAIAQISGVYCFSLIPALLVGSSGLPGAPAFAVTLWTAGAVTVTLAAGVRFSRFSSDARELRLPRIGRVLLRDVGWLLGAVVVLPVGLFWSFVPGARSWIWILMAAPLASVWVLMPRLTHVANRARRIGADSMPRQAVRARARAVSLFLGRSFAWIPKGPIEVGLTIFGVALWGAPLALRVIWGSSPWANLAPGYLALTFAVNWVWFMTDLGKFARDRLGAFAELALLPGMGNAGSQRRALYRAVLFRPLLIGVCCLAAGLLMMWPAWHSPFRLLRVGLGGVVLLLYCAAGIFQLLTVNDAIASRTTVLNQVLMRSVVPLILAPTLLVTLPGESWFAHPGAWRWYLIFLVVLAAVPVSVMGTWIYARVFARRAHPFLEVSS